MQYYVNVIYIGNIILLTYLTIPSIGSIPLRGYSVLCRWAHTYINRYIQLTWDSHVYRKSVEEGLTGYCVSNGTYHTDVMMNYVCATAFVVI